MKRVLILFLVLIYMLSFAACDKATSSGGSAVSGRPDVDKNVSGKTEQTQQTIAERIGIQQFRMTNAFDSEFELDYQNHDIMALKDVEVKGIPSDSIAYNRILNYELVRVHAAVYAENGKWVLVSYSTFDGGDDIGWVKVSDLTEYTDDTKEKLTFPVNVSADCKDIDTGEKVAEDDWLITSIEEENVNITKVGGICRKVKLEDIVYPEPSKAAE